MPLGGQPAQQLIVGRMSNNGLQLPFGAALLQLSEELSYHHHIGAISSSTQQLLDDPLEQELMSQAVDV
jgi:hypothetical protein